MEQTTINPLLFFVAMIPFGLLFVGFFYYMDRRLPVPGIPSSEPVYRYHKTEKTEEKAADPAGNAEAGSGSEKAAAAEVAEVDIIKAQGARRIKVFTHVHTLMTNGLTAEQVARLVDGGKNAELLPEIKAALKIVKASEVATILGGRTQETLRWLGELVGVSRPQEAVGAKEGIHAGKGISAASSGNP